MVAIEAMDEEEEANKPDDGQAKTCSPIARTGDWPWKCLLFAKPGGLIFMRAMHLIHRIMWERLVLTLMLMLVLMMAGDNGGDG